MKAETRAMYDSLRESHEQVFRGHAENVISEEITPETFEERMQRSLMDYQLQLALLAHNGVGVARNDLDVMRAALQDAYTRLDDFRSVLELNRLAKSQGQPIIYSDDRTLWRAASYSYVWGTFSRYVTPPELYDALPAFPGEDCLGGPKCGCWLDWDTTDDALNVYWHMDPSKENCALCAGFAVDWDPLVIEVFEFIDPDELEDVDLDDLEDLLF